MKRTVLLLLTLALSIPGPAGAQWRENGKKAPDTAFSKSDGDLGAMLLLTNKPEEFYSMWGHAKDTVKLVSSDVAERGSPMVAVVVFTGCAPAKDGFCNADVRFLAYGPDGKPYGAPLEGELWRGKPAPAAGKIQLGVGNLGIVIEPQDPLGEYTVRAEVTDRIAKKKLSLERTFKAVEPAAGKK